ncbi:hypothetical protein ALC53_04596, partial [Atta colombica]
IRNLRLLTRSILDPCLFYLFREIVKIEIDHTTEKPKRDHAGLLPVTIEIAHTLPLVNCRRENPGLIPILHKNFRRDIKLDFANELHEKRRGIILHDENNFDFPSIQTTYKIKFLYFLIKCILDLTSCYCFNKNNIYHKVAPPVPDAFPRSPPPLRIRLTSSRTGHSRKTLANNILQSRADYNLSPIT